MFVGVGAARVRDLVPPGGGEGALHRVHRRTRRPRQGPRAVADGRPRGAGTDAESVAGRDGRVRRAQGRHHHGGHQQAGGARPRPAPSRTVRSPRAGRPAGRQGPRGHPPDPRQGREAGRRRRPAPGRRAHGRIRGRRPGQPRQRGRAARRTPRQAGGRPLGLRRGHRPAHRRTRETSRHDSPHPTCHRRTRSRPRHRRLVAAGAGPRPQGLDRRPRLRRPRLHDAAAERGPVSATRVWNCSTSWPSCSAGARPRSSSSARCRPADRTT